MRKFLDFLKHLRIGLQGFTLLGFVLALYLENIYFTSQIGLALLAWLFLAAGATAFNSYYDKDEVPLPFLKHPPSVSRSLFWGSLALKIFGLILVILYTNIYFELLYIVGFLASILYSHKKTRLKSNGYFALLTNFASGIATYLAASTFSTHPNTTVVILGCFTSGFFLASVYLLMQIHEIDDDKRRGDISYAVKHGLDKTLKAAELLLGLAGILIAIIFYLKSNFVLIIVSLLYFTIGMNMISRWRNIGHNTDIDYIHMQRTASFLNYTACIIITALYIIQQA